MTIVLNNKIYKIILTAIHVELQDYFTEEKLFLHRNKTKDQNIHTTILLFKKACKLGLEKSCEYAKALEK